MLGQSTTIVVRRLAGLGLAAGLVLSGIPALGQDLNVSYPPSRAINDIANWLQHDTPLGLPQVVDISPSAVTAVTSAAPMGQIKGFLAALSSEALDPTVVSHDGIASWTIAVEVDCDNRQARLGAMTGFRSRDLQSEPRIVRNADTTWVSPVESSPLGSAIRALCERDFQRPFAARIKANAKSEPKPGRPPVIEVRPKRVAQAATKPPGSSPETKQADPPAAAPAAGVTLLAQAQEPPSGNLAAPEATTPAKTVPIPASTPVAQPKAEVKAKPKFKPPVGGGPHSVQIGASPISADVQGLLAHFKKKFSADLGGLSADLVVAQVDGKTVNRAIVSGFTSASEANAFCKLLADAGQACFIRH